MKTCIKNLFLLPMLIAVLGLSWHTAHAQSSTNLPAGLVAWWPGEGNASDIVGGNNGTLENGASFAPGEVGQAFAFNGANQFVQIPDSPSLEPTNFTLACWFNASNSMGSLVQKPVGTGNSDSYAFWFQGGNLNGKICNASAQGLAVIYNLTLVPGVWYHAAYTFDSGSQTETLYVNGSPVATNNAGIQIGYDSNPVLIGADNDFGSTVLPFTGEIDEVTLYDRALATNEIAAIYNAGIATTPPLSLASAGNQSVLFWPASATTHTLQSTTNLVSPNWVTVHAGHVQLDAGKHPRR
jgi:hypothetical protein